MTEKSHWVPSDAPPFEMGDPTHGVYEPDLTRVDTSTYVWRTNMTYKSSTDGRIRGWHLLSGSHLCEDDEVIVECEANMKEDRPRCDGSGIE